MTISTTTVSYGATTALTTLAQASSTALQLSNKNELNIINAQIQKQVASKIAALQGTTNPFADVILKQQAYGLKSCGASASTDAAVSAAQGFVGHYQGPWTNTTFGSTGTVDLTISLDTGTRTVTVVTALTGNVFGAPAPPAETLTVPLPTDSSTPVTVTSPTFGALTVTLQSDGSLVVDAPNVPDATAATFHLVLTPSAAGMDGTYTVGLRAGTTANGTVTLKKV